MERVRSGLFATAIFLTAAFTGNAQKQFDFENAEVVFESGDGYVYDVLPSVDGFLFDGNRFYNGTYASLSSGTVYADQAFGYDGHWANDGGGTNVTVPNTLMGYGEYLFTIQRSQGGTSLVFRLNTIDANWNEPNYPTLDNVYRILVSLRTSGGAVTADVYVQEPNSPGDFCDPVTGALTDANIAYWECRRAIETNYLRERDGFIIENAVLPDQNFTPQTVMFLHLDFNAEFRGDNLVYSTKYLIVTRDEDDPSSLLTTLWFDQDAIIVVQGILYVNPFDYQGEARFTSLSHSPGAWRGIEYQSDGTMFIIRNASFEDAEHGLDIYGANYGDIVKCWFTNSSDDALVLDECDAVHVDSCMVLENHDDGIQVNGMAFRSAITNSVIGSTVLNGYRDGNGIVVQQYAAPWIENCSIQSNAEHGIFAYNEAAPIVMSCEIGYNSRANTNPKTHDGVHANNSGDGLTVRYSKIYENNCGIRGIEYSTIVGYGLDTPGAVVEWDNPDSVAANCIFENRYDLYLDQSGMEMAIPLWGTDNAMHFQGGESCIFNPQVSPGGLGSFNTASTADVTDNYWYDPQYPNTLYYELTGGSTMDNNPVLGECSTSCELASPHSASRQTVQLQTPLSSFRSSVLATAKNKSACKSYIASMLPSLQERDAIFACTVLMRVLDTTEMKQYCAGVLAGTSSPMLHRVFRAFLAKTLIRERRWLEARDVYETVSQTSVASNPERFIHANIQAASMEYYAGLKTNAESRLGSLLAAYPGHEEAGTVWNLFFDKAFPKRGAESESREPSQPVSLSLPFPNPSTAGAYIDLTVLDEMEVLLEVFDMHGTRVASIANGRAAAGTTRYFVPTSTLRNGVYHCRLRTTLGTHVRALTVLR